MFKTIAELKTLRAENSRLKDQVAQYEELIENCKSELRKSAHQVDFEEMNAFSIERLIEGSTILTVIGYKVNDEIKEWYLRCDDIQHERLAEEFKQYMKKKNGN